jgi:hypothetical protein
MSIEKNEHLQSTVEIITKPNLLNKTIRKVLHLISLSINCEKSSGQFLGFLVCASKPSGLRFVSCATKPTGRCDDMEHALRSSGLLHLEVSRARVFQFASKLAEARRWVVHVAPLWMLHRDQVEDGRVDMTGYVGSCHPYIAVFFILCTRGVFVFSFVT